MRKKTKAERAARHQAWQQRQNAQGNDRGKGYDPYTRVVEVPYSAISRGDVGEGKAIDVSHGTMKFDVSLENVIAMISGNGSPRYFAARVRQFNRATRFNLRHIVDYEGP